MEIDLRRWAKSITKYSEWLAAQRESTARAWSQRLNSTGLPHVEGAVAEAVMWDYLACRCDGVRLAEVEGQGGPDFEFLVDGQSFDVEVTNLSIDKATDSSGLPDIEMSNGMRSYSLLTECIRDKIRLKDRQAKRSDKPILVAVTTLHWKASILCINRSAVEFAMGSTPSITGNLNCHTGEVEGDLYQSTDLAHSVFLLPQRILGPDGTPIVQPQRQAVSGFLIGGFGVAPRNVTVLGGVNPAALRPLDVRLLPDIPFCSFHMWPIQNEIEFDWTISEEEVQDNERRAAEKRLRASGHGEFLDKTREILRKRSGG